MKKADEICNYNRHYAEHSGYFESKTKFIPEAQAASDPIDFYDSNTGKLLFTAPVGRSMEDFLVESRAHGWPSFRDSEVRIMFRTFFVFASLSALLSENRTLIFMYMFSGKLGLCSMPSQW